MKDDTEGTHRSESRLRTALRTGISYAGIGSVFGYVGHVFFGHPRQTGFVSQAALRNTASNAAFFGVVGMALGALWPNRFGRSHQSVEVTLKPQMAENPAMPQSPGMAQPIESQNPPERPLPKQSYTAAEAAKRAAPAQEQRSL